MRKNAATLVEVMISATLMITVLGVTYTFYKYGQRYLGKTRTAVELQQSAGLTGSALIRDLSEAYAKGISSFPNLAHPAAPAGVVMLSARDVKDVFRYEPATGEPLWQCYVGYYLDADPNSSDAGVKALYRAEIVRGGLPRSSPLTPLAAGVTTQLLRTAGTNRKLVVGGLRGESPSLPHGGLDVYSLNAAGAKIYPVVLDNPVWMGLDFLNVSTGSQPNAIRTQLSVRARN